MVGASADIFGPMPATSLPPIFPNAYPPYCGSGLTSSFQPKSFEQKSREAAASELERSSHIGLCATAVLASAILSLLQNPELSLGQFPLPTDPEKYQGSRQGIRPLCTF